MQAQLFVQAPSRGGGDDRPGDGDEEAGPSRPVKRQASVTPYMPSAEKEAAVNKDVLCFIITSESPKMMECR
eukprot:158686-Pelagomonas_calceolata.AAC.1